MVVFFGLALDDHFEQPLSQAYPWAHYIGPSGLMRLLETAAGLDHGMPDMDYLRIPAFRKVIQQYLDTNSDAFFEASFQADQFATSKDLLRKRDELLLAGWDFVSRPDTPAYLKVFAALERLVEEDEPLQEVVGKGLADRFSRLLQSLPNCELPFQTIFHLEPDTLLPVHWQRLLRVLAAKGVSVQLHEIPQAPSTHHDLGAIQQLLQDNSTQKITLRGDGSFLILTSKRAADLSRQIAKIVAQHPEFRPTCLLLDQSLQFDMALAEEGLPALGLSQPSLSRPGQQVLKLAGSFLWQPVDPAKILEFAGLPVKPLQGDLAYAIARHIADKPGLFGEGWNAMINGTLGQLAQKSADLANEAREQYRFWFERKRYDIQQDAPTSEAIGVFRYIQFWALRQSRKDAAPVFGQLAEQARKAAELLETIPEQRVSALDIERVVRTIFDPIHSQLHTPQAGHLDFVRHANALLSPPRQLLWWNFTTTEKPYFFTHWTAEVIHYLSTQGIELDLPSRKNSFQSWSQKLPFRYTRNQLVLAIPESIDGKATHSHPVWPLISTRLTNAANITFQLDDPVQLQRVQQYFRVPEPVAVPQQHLAPPKPYLELGQIPQDWRRTHESPTSIETMVYYPYQWFFRYVLQWYKSPLLGIVNMQRLKGNLAHKLLEKLLPLVAENWSREALQTWVEDQLLQLMAREGTPLLLYGNEPEKVNFIRKVQFAAHTLRSLIRDNGWQILAIEKDEMGTWQNLDLKARADLVLERGNERLIMDFKWSGATRRREIMKNNEDLQLCLYASLYRNNQQWPSTCYFIIEPATPITRSPNAFKGIQALANAGEESERYPELMQKMAATWNWRIHQLEQGLVEMRSANTLDLLDEEDRGYTSDMLEMKTDDAPYDDYHVLLRKFN